MKDRAPALAGTGALAAPGHLLQRRCACGQHTIAGAECPQCRRNRQRAIGRDAAVPPIVQRAAALLLAPVGRLLGYGRS